MSRRFHLKGPIKSLAQALLLFPAFFPHLQCKALSNLKIIIIKNLIIKKKWHSFTQLYILSYDVGSTFKISPKSEPFSHFDCYPSREIYINTHFYFLTPIVLLYSILYEVERVIFLE